LWRIGHQKAVKMKSTYSPRELVELLQLKGYRASFECPEVGTNAIESGSSGFEWSLDFAQADIDEQVDSARFLYFIRVNPTYFPVGKICNDSNLNGHVGVAQFIFPDVDDEEKNVLLVFDHEMWFSGGVSTDWILSQLHHWDVAMCAFNECISANEEEVFEDDISFD